VTPIIKNGDNKTATIAVTDALGNTYANTYLRRAKGLVKKGRAGWIGNRRIRLLAPPQKFEEVLTMERIHNRLIFNASDWEFIEEQFNIGDRHMMTDLFNEQVMGYTLSNWNWKWAQIATQPQTLQPNCEHFLRLWVLSERGYGNGTHIQLEIVMYDEAPEMAETITYYLHGWMLKPVLEYDKWRLFEFKFDTKGFQHVQFHIGTNSVTHVLPAKDIETEKAHIKNLPEQNKVENQASNTSTKGWAQNFRNMFTNE
jgi:hypothetical protein